MFENFSLSRLLESHWSIVIGVGLLFLAMQLFLCLRLFLRARRRERILLRLCRDFQQGGDGRRGYRKLSQDFSWLQWVLAIFPKKGGSPSGHFTREEILDELDDRVASESDYLLLQRMGVMAPLLGVILTVVGFYWLEVDESGAESLSSILLAVTPLVSGVGTGAALALINQALLHLVGSRVERLRLTARTWFDAVIWNGEGLTARAATDVAVDRALVAVNRFTKVMKAAADRQEVIAQQLESSTSTMRSAAGHFADVFGTFQGEMSEIPGSLSELRGAMTSSSESLQQLIPVGLRAVANLDVSVAAFRSTIDREFAQAAHEHVRSSKRLAEAVRDINSTTGLLAAGAEQMKQIAGTKTGSVAPLDGNQRLHESIEFLAEKMTELGQVVDALASRVDSAARPGSMGGGLDSHAGHDSTNATATDEIREAGINRGLHNGLGNRPR